MVNKYTAITIGPIYKTFSKARKTRELWAVSFTFSLLARLIIENLLDDKGLNKEDFILPDCSKFDEQKKLKAVGLFPDRIIFKSDKISRAIVKQAINDSISKLSVEIATQIHKDSIIVEKLLSAYYKVYFIEKELGDDARPILDLSPYLDHAELQNRLISDNKAEDILREFFERVDEGANKDDSTVFMKKYFAENENEKKFASDVNGQIRIPSLVEIATYELRNKDRKEYILQVNNLLWNDEDGEFIKELQAVWNKKDIVSQSKVPSFKSYHKYICIINADGDKIGETLKRLKKGEEPKFSEKLLNWGMASFEIIREYGGLPIYIGGDDLLCFAPVSNGSNNVLWLIDEIQKAFNTQFPESAPSLSFGLSVSYYKYPMAEALSTAETLLKQAKENGGNSVAIKLLKHSGGEFETILNGNCQRKIIFDDVLNEMSLHDSFNNSLMFHLNDLRLAYSHIAREKDGERIWNMFQNHFDETKEDREGKPKDKKYQFYIRTKDLVHECFITENNNERGNEQAMKNIYSLMRLARFINGLEDANK